MVGTMRVVGMVRSHVGVGVLILWMMFPPQQNYAVVAQTRLVSYANQSVISCDVTTSISSSSIDPTTTTTTKKCKSNKDCDDNGTLCYEVIKDYFFNKDGNDFCNEYEGGCYCKKEPPSSSTNNNNTQQLIGITMDDLDLLYGNYDVFNDDPQDLQIRVTFTKEREIVESIVGSSCDYLYNVEEKNSRV